MTWTVTALAVPDIVVFVVAVVVVVVVIAAVAVVAVVVVETKFPYLLTYLPTILPTCLSTLREADVIAVTVGVGSNDACVEGCEGHVPVSQAS